MRLGTVLLGALAAWLALRWAHAQARRAAAGRLPPGISAPDPGLGDLSGPHQEAAVQALRAFATEYRLTFQHGGCSRRSALALHGLREEALRHLYQLRMRLPNDLDAEAGLTAQIEDADALLRAYIDDAQRRCGLSLLHPGPLDDTFYRRWWRAHNDTGD